MTSNALNPVSSRAPAMVIQTIIPIPPIVETRTEEQEPDVNTRISETIMRPSAVYRFLVIIEVAIIAVTYRTWQIELPPLNELMTRTGLNMVA
ncbi:hypothetical protein BR93DRAFT_930784 [Coniochaeta sp. PMI_546]|nr:hypothetical protein BR93DRAFT_930784 [Coniochaeta sp. PMI_546]